MTNSKFALGTFYRSTLILRDATFSSISSGAFIKAEATTVEFYQNTFESSHFSAIYADFLSCNVSIDFCKFEALEIDDDFMLKLANSSVSIKHSSFNRIGTTVLSAEYSEVMIEFSNFFNRLIDTKIQMVLIQNPGGAIVLENSNALISNCGFTQLKASKGGAIYISNNSTSIIRDCTFSNCSSSMGGAIAAYDSPLNITSSIFKNNSAISNGGAIMQLCKQNYCVMSVRYSVFLENTAMEGGAISWKDFQPQLEALTFTNNSAYYGKDLASYPQSIQFIGPNLMQLSNSSIIEASSQYFKSPLLIGVFDVYDQLVNRTYDDLLYLKSIQGTLVGTAYKQAEHGIFNFTNIKVISEPSSTVTLSANWKTSESPMNLSTEYTILLRACDVGEMVNNGSCIVCPTGTYGKTQGISQCLFCPSHAECYGGSSISVNDGYWKLNQQSDEIYECMIDTACIGGETVTCDSGYSGRLCSECEANYERFGSYNCQECLSIVYLTLKLVLGTASIWGVTALVIYYFYTKKYAVLLHIRCWFNYIQTVSIFSQYIIVWPDPVLKFYQAFYMIGTLSVTSLASNCILKDINLKTVYFKLVFLNIFPLLIAILSLVIWLIVGIKRRSFKNYIQNSGS